MNNEGIPTEDQIKKTDKIKQFVEPKNTETAISPETKAEYLSEFSELKTEDLTESANSTKKRLNELRGNLGIPQERMAEKQNKTENENLAKPLSRIPISKEKLERLRYLNRAKELMGNLYSDEEKERATLISEYDDTLREYQLNIANDAPSEIKFESPVEIFTENDVLKWKDGSQRFKELSTAIQNGSMQQKFERVFNPISTSELKALFLKEKPVVLLQSPIDVTNSDNIALINLLKSFGVEIMGNYLYDKIQVRDVMQTHNDIFKDIGSNDPDEVMNILHSLKTQDDGVEKKHLAIGVLLGIPVGAAKKFEHFSKEQKKGVEFPKTTRMNVYGIQWADFDDSLESKIRQAKLKSAFELSGILDK